MTRLVVTGNKGQVAMSLQERVNSHPGLEVVGLGRPDLDLEKPDRIRSVLAAKRPDVIVNAAANTAVDLAESEEAVAMAINRDGAGAVAAAAESLGVPLVHLSTDYVYDGKKGSPYVETDATHPLNVYGQSKLAGEVAVRSACPSALILRTAWVYSPHGNNFVKTMLRLGRERTLLRVVNDQWGNPTSAIDLADALLRIVPALLRHQGTGKTLHLAGSDPATWFKLAHQSFRIAHDRGVPSPRLEAVSTSDYPLIAIRPMDTRLNLSAFAETFHFELPGWQSSLVSTVNRLV